MREQLVNVEIRRPKEEDREELHHFFRLVITDTFIKDGIGEKLADIEEEIEVKKQYLESAYESKGQKRFFLVAMDGDKIIGSIEYGAASKLICQCTNHALEELVEIGTVFVHPDYQGKGVGNLLLHYMFKTLENKEIQEFCLDSGYKRAQVIWKKKFGEPDYLLESHWGPESDHMIWRVKVKDCSSN